MPTINTYIDRKRRRRGRKKNAFKNRLREHIHEENRKIKEMRFLSRPGYASY